MDKEFIEEINNSVKNCIVEKRKSLEIWINAKTGENFVRESRYFYDDRGVWIGYFKNNNYWSVITKKWVGPIKNNILYDKKGKVIAHSLSVERVKYISKPAKPSTVAFPTKKVRIRAMSSREDPLFTVPRNMLSDEQILRDKNA